MGEKNENTSPDQGKARVSRPRGVAGGSGF